MTNKEELFEKFRPILTRLVKEAPDSLLLTFLELDMQRQEFFQEDRPAVVLVGGGIMTGMALAVLHPEWVAAYRKFSKANEESDEIAARIVELMPFSLFTGEEDGA